ncbi:MAG: hypothetical protein AAGG09_14000 [Pseudomonadota bacterium]
MTEQATSPLNPQTVAAYFTRSDGAYVFSRWGRPMAPVVFGVADKTLETMKGALEAVASLTGRKLAEVDPELGTNLMIFFVRDWEELKETPDLDRLIPDLAPLIARLEEAEANQYRVFRFDKDGAIRACFAFVKMDQHMAVVPAETLALTQAVQVALLWSDTAFSRDMEGANRSMLARTEAGHTILSPQVADLLQAAYDPVLPDYARDPSHALRLAARMGMTKH